MNRAQQNQIAIELQRLVESLQCETLQTYEEVNAQVKNILLPVNPNYWQAGPNTYIAK